MAADFVHQEGRSFVGIAAINTKVTAVDAMNFLRNHESVEELRDGGEAMGEEDERPIVDLFDDQIEFANVVVINKLDLIEGRYSRYAHFPKLIRAE